MTTEAIAATPDAAAVPSGESAVNPEVADQEHVEARPEGEAKPQRTEAEKRAYSLERRVGRLTRDKAELNAELQMLRQQPRQQPTDEETPLSQADIDRLAEEKANAKVAAQRVNDRCNEIAKQGAKEFKGDFDKAMAEVHSIAPLFDRQGRPEPLMQAILETDEPHKVLHYLGTNPDVAEEIADMSPLRAARRLGQIERDLATKPLEPKPSNAPKPLQPVKSAAASGEPDPSKDAAGWMKWRNEQLRGARK